MKTLIILIGNIGSGKSTLSQQYAKEGYIIASRDSIRYMIGGGNYVFNQKYEKTVRRIHLKYMEEFMKLGVNVLNDECNMTKRTRRASIQLAKRYGYTVIGIVLPKISKEESIKRRCNSPHGEFKKATWESVWEMFNECYQEPDEKEGFDAIIFNQ